MAFGLTLQVTENTCNSVKPSMWLILVLMFFLDYYLKACQGYNLVCSKIINGRDGTLASRCHIQWLTVDSVLMFCRGDEGRRGELLGVAVRQRIGD